MPDGIEAVWGDSISPVRVQAEETVTEALAVEAEEWEEERRPKESKVSDNSVQLGAKM